MSLGQLISIFSLLVLLVAIAGSQLGSFFKSSCRYIPGDGSWPDQEEWDKLNQTVSGRLISTIPIAAVCHKTFSGTDNTSLYNEEDCDALRRVWLLPETHLADPASAMAYAFTNNSRDPFLYPDTPCTIGYYPA